MGLLDKIKVLIQIIAYAGPFLIICIVAYIVFLFLVDLMFFVPWEYVAILIILIILWRLYVTYKAGE